MMPFLQNTAAEEPRRIFAAGPALAYYMAPPEAAVRPFVKGIAWTADGSTLIVTRLVPPRGASPLALAEARQTVGLKGMMKLRPRVQVVAWSKAGGASRTLLDLDSARATVVGLEAMAASDRALVLLSETPVLPDGTVAPPREAYVLLATSTGAVARLWTGASAEDDDAAVLLSPKRAMGAVLRGRRDALHSVSIFGADGKPGPAIPLAPGRRFGFAADGGPGIATLGLDKKGKRTYAFQRMDPRTGALGAAAVEGGFEDEEPQEPPMRVRQGKEGQGVFLHVQGGQPLEQGLVSLDGALPLLSPRYDAVAYVQGSGAYVRSLVKVDRKAYEAAVLEGEKEKAITTARQVGTAVSMYAMDYDDAFPMNDQKGSVEPYLKDRAMLDRFVYTFGGGTPPAGGNPATTQIGYVAGPGGRAVVYADGSVKWVPDGF